MTQITQMKSKCRLLGIICVICAICGKDLGKPASPYLGVNTIRFTSKRGLPKFSRRPRSMPVAFK